MLTKVSMESGSPMSLADRVRSLREERGWSLRQLERVSGVSNATISLIETGKQKNPTADTLRKLAGALGVGVEVLMGRTDDPTPPGREQAADKMPDEQFEALLRGRGLSQHDIEWIKQLEKRRAEERAKEREQESSD